MKSMFKFYRNSKTEYCFQGLENLQFENFEG